MQLGTPFDARSTWNVTSVAVWALASALAGICTPSAAQGTPVAQATDSAYLARMNAGYAAGNSGNQAAAAAAFDLAAQAAPLLAEPLSAAGYAYLAAGNKPTAIARFKSAVALDESRDIIWRQLGYLYADARQNREAIAAFSSLKNRNHATAQDHLALGNLNALVGEREVALASFRLAADAAAQAGDTVVAKAAATSIKNLTPVVAPTGAMFWLEYYVSPFYQHRFDNVVTAGFIRAGVSAGGWWRPSVYASVRATRDSKSVGGFQPALYADNSVLPALGIRIQPGSKGLTLYAEAGAAYPLVNVKPRDWRRDLRAGAVGGVSNTHLLTANANGFAIISDAYADVSWYDRFNRNVIAYLQWRESLRMLQGRAGAVDIYTRAWSAIDSRNTYYDRVVEGGVGIALYGGASHRVSLFAEVIRGHYLKEPIGTQPPRNYNDFRVTLVTGLYRATPVRRP